MSVILFYKLENVNIYVDLIIFALQIRNVTLVPATYSSVSVSNRNW